MTYMQKFRSSRANDVLQKILRVFQFLSPVISIGFFASRLVKIARLGQRLTKSNGAVAAILAAAIVYTLIAMLLQFCLKRGGPKPIRWLMVLFDLLFTGAFIAVAYLTRPHGGSSGPCTNVNKEEGRLIKAHGQNCNLPWATFILAIISTVLHLLTAVFHEVKDHMHQKHHRNDRNGYDNSNNGYGNGDVSERQ